MPGPKETDITCVPIATSDTAQIHSKQEDTDKNRVVTYIDSNCE